MRDLSPDDILKIAKRASARDHARDRYAEESSLADVKYKLDAIRWEREADPRWRVPESLPWSVIPAEILGQAADMEDPKYHQGGTVVRTKYDGFHWADYEVTPDGRAILWAD